MNPDQFAEKIKNKYPEYKDMDNLELARKIIQKYPQYESQVTFPDEQTYGEDAKQDFKQMGQTLNNTLEQGRQSRQATRQRVQNLEISPVEGTYQTLGGGLFTGAKFLGESALGLLKMALPQKAEDKAGEMAGKYGEAINQRFQADIEKLRNGNKDEQNIAQKYDEFTEKYETDENFRANVDATIGYGQLFTPVLSKLKRTRTKVRTPDVDTPDALETEELVAQAIDTVEDARRQTSQTPRSYSEADIPKPNSSAQEIQAFRTSMRQMVEQSAQSNQIQEEILQKMNELIAQKDYDGAFRVVNSSIEQPKNVSISEKVTNAALDTAVMTGQRVAQTYRDLVEGATNRTTQILDRRALQDNANLTPDQVNNNIADMYVSAVSPGVKGKRKTVEGITANKKSAVSAIQSIVQNKDSLKFRDIETNQMIEGALPSNLWEFGGAITDQKSKVYQQVLDSIGKAADEPIDTSRIIDAMTEIIENPIYSGETAVINRAQQQLNKYLTTDYTPSQLEELIKLENDRLQAFYRGSGTQADAVVSAIVANNLRDMLDEAVEAATGEGVSQLKRQYGDLKAIENDVIHRALHNAQAREAGLVDMFGIRTIGDVSAGLAGDLGALRRGAGQIAGEGFINALNDRDAMVNRMFLVADQEYIRMQNTPR